jgi:hypothetical protein
MDRPSPRIFGLPGRSRRRSSLPRSGRVRGLDTPTRIQYQPVTHSVRWHMANPTDNVDDDFTSDDRALEQRADASRRFQCRAAACMASENGRVTLSRVGTVFG